jgi:hypothetical protein
MLGRKLVIRKCKGTEYMFIFHHQTARQYDNMKVINKSLKNGMLKYLGMMISILHHEEIQSRLSLGNTYHHAVQNLSSHLVCKNKYQNIQTETTHSFL